jgi:Flp pilus assembly protein TadB
MVKKGLDHRAFAESLKQAPPEQRAELQSRFWAWVKEGGRQSGPYVMIAVALWGGAALLIIFAFGLAGWAMTGAFVLAVILSIAAVPVFQISARRERRWREANPFEVE